jgi:hypothetical protein
MKMNTSSTGTTRSALTCTQEEMKKQDKLSPGIDIMERTRDGKSSTLMMPRRFKVKDFMKTSDSTSIDHSTSDPDFH